MLYRALSAAADALWGLPTVALIVGTGLYFTVKMNFLQLTSIKDMQLSVKNNFLGKKNSKPLEAVSTALAATVGTGSVTGVATALAIGGAGSVFWLWVSAFFGMAVAYAEGVLSIRYRNGKKGGIMYAVRDGLKEPVTACAYAVFTLLASFGMGAMAQTNSAADALNAEFSLPPWILGLFAAILAFICLFSGDDFTGKLCAAFVPILSAVYLAAVIIVIIMCADRLPAALDKIFASAFGLKPAIGGALGYTVKQAVSTGFKRGVFSNEAGLGTTAAIHAESETVTPHEQGLLNMLEVVIDTFVICTLTALCIICSGADLSGKEGAAMVTEACGRAFGRFSGGLIALCIAGFALATIMGWSKIGQSAADYLFENGRKPLLIVYKLGFISAAFLGAVMSLDAVWKLSDLFNGLMIPPCMAALILLRKEIINTYHKRPVEPKPCSPRSEEGSESD